MYIDECFDWSMVWYHTTTIWYGTIPTTILWYGGMVVVHQLHFFDGLM